MRMPWTPPESLSIGRGLWSETISELARRGEGRRESGAFLLGDAGSRRVQRLIYFDDLDPEALKGHIHLRGFAFSELWRICRESGLDVIADAHTHPGAGVRQSSIDRDNPFIARKGHVALILPRYAAGDPRVRELGFHLYRGERGWVSHLGRAAARRVRVRRRG